MTKLRRKNYLKKNDSLFIIDSLVNESISRL